MSRGDDTVCIKSSEATENGGLQDELEHCELMDLDSSSALDTNVEFQSVDSEKESSGSHLSHGTRYFATADMHPTK